MRLTLLIPVTGAMCVVAAAWAIWSASRDLHAPVPPPPAAGPPASPSVGRAASIAPGCATAVEFAMRFAVIDTSIHHALVVARPRDDTTFAMRVLPARSAAE